MISEFDKSGAVALYRREFTESLYAGDYETALDNLLKYDEAIGYVDFHLACGKLYLLMSQDSDDNELLVLAFRELMMYLRCHPDCKSAYRDILAVQMLRHDPAGTLECAEFAKRNGVDTEDMFFDLSQAGVDLFMDESIGLDLDSLLEPGEFGDIEIVDELIHDEPDYEEEKQAEVKPESKVVKFKGSAAEEPVGTGNAGGGIASKNKRVVEIKQPDNFIITDDGDYLKNAELDGFEFKDDDSSDEDMPNELLEKLDGKLKNTNLAAQFALRDAEKCGERGDYAAALTALDKIKPTDGHYYYCAECMRAFIHLQRNDIPAARAALDTAFSVHKRGALATVIMCKLYEDIGEYEMIPPLLKNADVKDYTDAAHVYQAMTFAIKYCTPKDAIALAEDYIEEFNTMDIRLLHAQMLYNNGKRKRATRELYKLSRIFYDDFNTVFYYQQALLGVKQMLVDDQVPQEILTRVVDGLINIHKAGTPSNTLIKSEDYKLALEMFLTLEFPKQHKLFAEMTDVLRDIVADKRLEQKLRDSLVSPYVEPIVKAVILTELFTRSSDFTVAVGFCPDSNVASNINPSELCASEKIAVAYILCLDRELYDKFTKQAEYYSRLFKVLNGTDIPVTDRDKAYYMLKSLKSKMFRDGRVITALGYDNKKAAADAYDAIDAVAQRFQ